MIKRWLYRGLILIWVGCLALGMTGCQGSKAAVPAEVVTAAIARQAQREQTQLWQKLATHSAEAPTLTVKKVQVKRVQAVQVATDLAYRVTGTYQYRLRYPDRRQVKQSQVPFALIVQAAGDSEGWRLLERGTAVGDRPWQWRSLSASVGSPSNPTPEN
ncbi:MAG TPA: hypothetical protein V6D02_03425 [Candidatus Obscuribacterales bacterium]